MCLASCIVHMYLRVERLLCCWRDAIGFSYVGVRYFAGDDCLPAGGFPVRQPHTNCWTDLLYLLPKTILLQQHTLLRSAVRREYMLERGHFPSPFQTAYIRSCPHASFCSLQPHPMPITLVSLLLLLSAVLFWGGWGCRVSCAGRFCSLCSTESPRRKRHACLGTTGTG